MVDITRSEVPEALYVLGISGTISGFLLLMKSDMMVVGVNLLNIP